MWLTAAASFSGRLKLISPALLPPARSFICSAERMYKAAAINKRTAPTTWYPAS